MRNKLFLLVILLVALFNTSCSYNAIKPIKSAKEINFIVVSNGIAVNSGILGVEDGKKLIDWHNDATFISREKENPLNEILPNVEKYSNSSILIYINPDWAVRIIYKGGNIFKVIHELEGKQLAYYIKSPELLKFIRENRTED